MDTGLSNKLNLLNRKLSRVESLLLANSAADAYALDGDDKRILMESVAERSNKTGKPVTMRVISELAEGNRDRREIIDELLG